jgi:type IV secretion system protein VirB10
MMASEDRDQTEPPQGGAFHDRRVKPRGALPRYLQTWAMVAVAGAILVVTVISGRPNGPRRPADARSTSQAATALPPDRLRRYQEQLAEQEAALRKELADAQGSAAATSQPPTPSREVPRTDPIADERRRREYASLFADSVAFTRRAAGTAATSSSPMRTTTVQADQSPQAVAQPPATPPVASHLVTKRPDDDMKRLLEGTVIEAVLTNRLEGSFSNPVNAMVTTPVYNAERQTVLIPTGARVLGTASPVQAFGETRLAVKFHRLVMPDGTTYTLDQFPGLNERGDAGLNDQVDRHYLQIFGASIALGSLSGLAQYATRTASNAEYGFSDAFGQGMGGSLATSSGRVLDRFLNVLPSVTIREGHRLKIYLTRDLDLPPYRDQPVR